MTRLPHAVALTLLVTACAAPTGAIRGTVLSSSGPVGNCVVQLSPSPEQPGARSTELRTDPRGEFLFRQLAAGRYRLAALNPSPEPLAPKGLEASIVELPRGTVRGVLLRLVWETEGSAISGRTVDQFDRPVSGVSVCGFCRSKAGADRECDKSDELGLFALSWIGGGECSISATLSGSLYEGVRDQVAPARSELRLVLQYKGTVRGTVVDETGAPLPDFRVFDEVFKHGSFELPAKRRTKLIEVAARGLATEVVAIGSPDQHGDVQLPKITLTRGSEVRGRILDAATGEPVRGAVVQLPVSVHRNRHPHWTGCGNCDAARRERMLPVVTSAGDGTFSFPHLSARQPQLVVTHDEYVDQPVDVGGGEGLVVKLSRGGIIRGRVLDAALRPVPGARVDAPAASRGASTAEDGSFVLSGLTTGTQRLRIELPKKAPFTRRVDARVGAETVVDLREPSGGTVVVVDDGQRDSCSGYRLLPGSASLPSSLESLEELLEDGLRPQPFEPPCEFAAVPSGPGTLIRWTRDGKQIRVEAQTLEISGGRLAATWSSVTTRIYEAEIQSGDELTR